MDQVLGALILCQDFVDTKEKTFLDKYIFATYSVILEEMTDELNQSLLYLNLNFARQTQVFLAHSKVRHLFSELLVSTQFYGSIHLLCLLCLALLFHLCEGQLLGLFLRLLLSRTWLILSKLLRWFSKENIADYFLLFKHSEVSLNAVLAASLVLLSENCPAA